MKDPLILDVVDATKAATRVSEKVRVLCSRVRDLEGDLAEAKAENYEYYRESVKHKEQLEDAKYDARESEKREILDELRTVLELAWRVDPSLVEYHLRRLEIEPTVELVAVQAERGRAA